MLRAVGAEARGRFCGSMLLAEALAEAPFGRYSSKAEPIDPIEPGRALISDANFQHNKRSRGSFHARIICGSVQGSWPDLTGTYEPRRLQKLRGRKRINSIRNYFMILSCSAAHTSSVSQATKLALKMKGGCLATRRASTTKTCAEGGSATPFHATSKLALRPQYTRCIL